MASLETLATVFGRCSVISVGFLFALLLRGFLVRKLAVRVLGVTIEEVMAARMQVFLQNRTATLVFSVTPYIALKIMAW